MNDVEYIIKNGKRYKPDLCPQEIERGRVGDCFDMCILNAMRIPQLRYVEGLAKNPLTGDWILHAWLTNGTHAFDPTWLAYTNDGEEKVIPTEYVGIEMNTKLVMQFMLDTRYKGIIANAWRDRKKADILIYGLTKPQNNA